jgi:cold shock CspA family protein
MRLWIRLGLVVSVAALLFTGSRQASASSGITTRVSVDSSGNQANNWSWYPAVTDDGLVLAFHSWASNLVAGDTNQSSDIFVHDRQTGVTERVSVGTGGRQSNGESSYAAISSDGRYVAFDSYATNLVADDTNGARDVFVRDRLTGATERLSVDSAGGQGIGDSSHVAISADGRYVAFRSSASNLAPGDTNGNVDVFVHDRQTGLTERVSLDSSGNQGNGDSAGRAVSDDGRYVAFDSYATNLVADDTNGARDVFVRDRQTGTTERVSVDGNGNEGNGESASPAISSDGRYVAFDSLAANLVPNDTNGKRDVFVHDRQTGATERATIDSSGNEGNDHTWYAALSGDGRYVAFHSSASNLVAQDSNNAVDIFVHDRQIGTTWRASVSSTGNQANNYSHVPAISADGRYVAFHSLATNLVLEDTNGNLDVFIRDAGPAAVGGIAVLPGPVGGGGLWENPGAVAAAAAVVSLMAAACFLGRRWAARRPSDGGL